MTAPSGKKDANKAPEFDFVLKRMLNTPPDPKKKTEPQAPSEKKPAG